MFSRTKTEPVKVDPEVQAKVNAAIRAYQDEKPVPGTCNFRRSFGDRAYCGRKVVAGCEWCYWHLRTTEKYSPAFLCAYFGREIDLSQALMEELQQGRSLEGAFLRSCSLGGDFLRSGPDLTGICFINADLRGSSLSETNFSSATFALADLTGAKLSSCTLTNVNFFGAHLFETKFRDNDLQSVQRLLRTNFRGIGRFGIPVERMLEQYPEQAAPMYRQLVSYFAARSLFDDASWAAYRSSVLRHRVLSKECNWRVLKFSRLVPAFGPVRGPVAIEYMIARLRWLKSGVFLLVTGFGEKPFRVVLTSILLIFAYSLLYCTPGAFTGHGFTSSLYFSMITFTTLGYGDVLPLGKFRLVAGSEALCGILFTGLFLFCLGRKTVSRA